jgi:glycine/D-amino acid oxidase-like deaminating enzyme
MTRQDVIVVGAGFAGLLTARALRALGRDVVVLEQAERAGTEASGRSAAMIRQDAPDPDVQALCVRGAALHREGTLGAFRATGSLLIGAGEEPASRRIPFLRGRARFEPGDGVVDAGDLLASLLEGGPAPLRRRVLAIERGPRVVTDDTEVSARVVVNAAGAWAGALGDLPLAALKRHAFIVLGPRLPPDAPFAWDLEHGLYIRWSEEGLIACACDERASTPGDNTVEPDAYPQLMLTVERAQPGLLPLHLVSAWAGQRTFAPDRKFVIGWDPRTAGVFWVAGLGGHGVTAAPAVGELAARMIAAGPGAPLPDQARAFAPARLLP